MRTILAALTMCLLAVPVQAKYSGGTGEPNDPYQIATAADLIALGDTPADYDKHFILTADIDLDPNLPGRKVFNRAIVAPAAESVTASGVPFFFVETPFTGVFDGKGHTISHLTIWGSAYLGLFGCLDAPASVSNLGLEAVEISGTGGIIGGLVGRNDGSISNCCSTGSVIHIGFLSTIKILSPDRNIRASQNPAAFRFSSAAAVCFAA